MILRIVKLQFFTDVSDNLPVPSSNFKNSKNRLSLQMRPHLHIKHPQSNSLPEYGHFRPKHVVITSYTSNTKT